VSALQLRGDEAHAEVGGGVARRAGEEGGLITGDDGAAAARTGDGGWAGGDAVAEGGFGCVVDMGFSEGGADVTESRAGEGVGGFLSLSGE
jgi:hypothetical protein